MKIYYIILLMAILTIVSCKNNQKEASVLENKTEAHQTEKVHESMVSLTDEQIKAIGLKTGSIEFRNLKTTLKVNGKLTLPPQNQAQVSVLSSGVVKSISVTEGQFVNKGQILATLVNNEMIQLQQDYLENKSQLIYLQQEYKRQKSLQEENINATKIFQQVSNDLNIAESRQKGIKEKLLLQGILTEKISASNFINRINVTAPISGFIHHINITMGKFADANTVLFDIVDNRFLHLDLTIFEKDIHKVKVGQKVSFTDANDKTHTHPATIFALNKAFETNQQAIIAHAKIDEKTEVLLPGMYMEARIQIDNNKAKSLPDEAIVSNGDEHYIYIEIKKNQFKQLSIKTGASDVGYTEVIPLEEIPDNAKLVISGAYYLLSQLTKGEGEHHD